jgi:hypothetical protein
MSKKTDKEEENDRWFIDDEDDDDDDEEDLEEVEEDEEDENESDEEERVLDKNDLTQIPGVDTSLAKKFKREKYLSLWDIACAEVEDLVNIIGVTSKTAKKMIEAANELLGF